MARRAGCDVLGAIIEIQNRIATFSRDAFHDLIQLRVRFHGAVFVGKNVAGEIRKKRKPLADVTDGQFIRV